MRSSRSTPIRKRIGVGIASLALALGFGAVGAAPAQAAATSCSNLHWDGTNVTGTCYGSGSATVKFTCYKSYPWETTWSKTGKINVPSSFSWTVGQKCNPLTNDWKIAVS